MKRYRSFISYAAVSLFVLVFGLIYTANGYGVTSPYMSFAFLPTAVIALLYLFPIHGIGKLLSPFSAMTLAFFASSATAYSIIQGIFEIAGAFSNHDVWLVYLTILCGGAFLGFYLSQYLDTTK